MTGLPSVPQGVLQYIEQAAKGTGLPVTVVAAQNYDESDYGSNQGPSSAGALGPWQFMPGTFTRLGFPAGQENSWPVSTQAYIKYMNQLLAQEHGNVRNALAAYNAGPGNLGAGYGYADGILAQANQTATLTVATSGSNTGANASAGLPGILGIPDQITGFFSKANDFVTAVMWITKPENWLRVGAFFAGILLLAFAVYALINANSDEPLVSMPKVVPVPI